MAKFKPEQRRRMKTGKKLKPNGNVQKPKASPQSLLDQATALLHTSQPNEALIHARRALALLQSGGTSLSAVSLPALSLLGEIYVELGDQESARDSFLLAESVDPDGAIPETAGGGAEKFFWLAQLSEEGGEESVKWFKKGADVLRKEIAGLETTSGASEAEVVLEEKKSKLANALCGIVEVYMTDLSWEGDAEAVCDALITEALLMAPESPGALQTLASVRISQTRHEDARAALSRSISLWRNLEPEDPRVPDFATRISLSRLLMETEMHDEAIEVLERLITEDDSSVEAWYLGGWCLHLASDATASGTGSEKQTNRGKSSKTLMKASREWLENCLKLYQMVGYEDERLREHAAELMETLNRALGPQSSDQVNDDDDDGDDDEWEDEEQGEEDESSDEEMNGK